MSTEPNDPKNLSESSTEASAVVTVDPAAVSADPLPQTAGTGDQPQRRRRRRRRRSRRHPPGATSSTMPAENSAAPPRVPSEQPLTEGALPATTQQSAPVQMPAGNATRKRRRRHRRRRPEGTRPAAASPDATSGALAAPVPASAGPEAKESRNDGDGHRRERRDRSRDERARDSENRRKHSHGPRVDEGRVGEVRGSRDKRRARDRDDRRQRDRDDWRKKPEPKLYRLESVVDRGFEDVADAGMEGATRRVDWAILKRTTADQRTARALSAIYVVRRDGLDTEFAQLSAARAAVNKTITHPEKLTPSKADHASARGAKK